MTKREKVILGLMLTAVVFGAFSFLSTSSENKAVDKEKSINELNKAIVELAGKINRNSSSHTDYILEKAKEAWKKDPFVKTFDRVGSPEKEKRSGQTATGPAAIIFTGFIHVGDKMIAIINGMEYEKGDMIENSSLSVQKITREKVVLRSEMGGDQVVFIEKY